jgi:hypothetical protein
VLCTDGRRDGVGYRWTKRWSFICMKSRTQEMELGTDGRDNFAFLLACVHYFFPPILLCIKPGLRALYLLIPPCCPVLFLFIFLLLQNTKQKNLLTDCEFLQIEVCRSNVDRCVHLEDSHLHSSVYLLARCVFTIMIQISHQKFVSPKKNAISQFSNTHFHLLPFD